MLRLGNVVEFVFFRGMWSVEVWETQFNGIVAVSNDKKHNDDVFAYVAIVVGKKLYIVDQTGGTCSDTRRGTL